MACACAELAHSARPLRSPSPSASAHTPPHPTNPTPSQPWPGTSLFNAGAPAIELHLLLHGRVDVYEGNGKLKCTHASHDLDRVVLVDGAGAADAPVPPLPIGMLPLPGAKPQRLTAVAADDGCVVLVGGGAAAELLLPLLHATHDAPPIVPLGDPTSEVEAEAEAEGTGAGEAAAGGELQPTEQPTEHGIVMWHLPGTYYVKSWNISFFNVGVFN